MRKVDMLLLVGVVGTLLLGLAAARAQNANDGFDPNANSTVGALAVQPDGKILVGGSFTTIAGASQAHIARLLPDGSLDAGFTPLVDSSITAIAVQSDGRIVIAGAFTQVGTYARGCIARLNADGSVDSAFDPNANSFVYALALQPDGKLLLGGNFSTLSGGAVTRHYIARLNADGSVDSAFDPNANATVYALAEQPDGKLLLGGNFSTLNGGTVTRNHIARLNADGSVDSAFDPNANSFVYALAVQPDGGLLLGGAFTTLNGGAVTRNRVARLHADGSMDYFFDPNANNTVEALAVQPDGKLLMGGVFTTLNNGTVTRHNIARLNADGSVDTLDVAADNTVYALAVQSDGKILLGGTFSTVYNGSVTRNHIARLNADGSGTLDETSDPEANNAVFSMAVQPDGELLLGGAFTTLISGVEARNHIVQLNGDGVVNITFDPNANNSVLALAVQSDGKILLGGYFTTLNGGAVARNHIARLNADIVGSVDSAFDPNTNSVVLAMAEQPDGKLLLGGNFTTLNGGAVTRNYIARLNSDGSVDSTFDPNANSTVLALAVQADGKILLGGHFTTLNGGAVTRNRIARLNADGSVDRSFDPNANGNVDALATQPDGRLLLGGAFTTLNGGAVTRNRIARLNADGSVDGAFDPNANSNVNALAVQPDGKVLLGGNFMTLNGGTVARNFIARLNADGSVDSAFNPNANSSVDALAVQSDGKLLLGGTFTTLNNGGVMRHYIARLSMPEAALQSLDVNGSTVTWKRSGAGPELVLPPVLELSVGGTLYAPLGTLTRIPGGWRASGILTQPVGQKFYLRVRGAVSSGQDNGSQGLIESVRQFFGNDRIFADGFE